MNVAIKLPHNRVAGSLNLRLLSISWRSIAILTSLLIGLQSQTAVGQQIRQVDSSSLPPSALSTAFASPTEGSPVVFGSQTDDRGCLTNPLASPCHGVCQSCFQGVDCKNHLGAEGSWDRMSPIDFNAYGQGGYAGPARLAHLRNYRLRPGDNIQIIYLLTRQQEGGAYRLEIGDEVLIESITDGELNRGNLQSGLRIQPDGSISVRLLGQVQAAGLTADALRQQLEKSYEELYEKPAIDVTPVRTNSLAEDLRDAVGGQGGFNAQVLTAIVMPDGKIRLPGIGEACVQGLTLGELTTEINLRYAKVLVGLEIEAALLSQAPHFVYVLGEVRTPSRVQLNAPTTVLGALASAGGTLPGSNLRQVVVMRRAEDWRLVSTMLDLQGAVYGKRPTPADEIWLQDGDVIVVPSKPILRLNWFVRQVFTEGIYGVVPFGVAVGFGNQN